MTNVSNDGANPIDISSPDIDDNSSRFSSPPSDEDESENSTLDTPHPLGQLLRGPFPFIAKLTDFSLRKNSTGAAS